MSFGPSFHDNQPITWWKRVPIYATTILTAGLALGLIISVFMASARGPLDLFTFSPFAVAHGKVWQLFTYPFVDLPSFFTLLGIMCFYSWAVEIEKYLGRARLWTLFALLTLVPVALSFALWGLLGVGYPLSGNNLMVASLLVGFATLYPNIEYFGWIPLKWFAFACILLGSLMHFPNHDWLGLGMLWISCATAFGYIRFIKTGGSIEMPKVASLFRPKPRLRVLPDPDSRDSGGGEEDSSMPEVDALLDKIARSGIGSLTARERGKLERAREELLRRETPRR